MYGIHSAGANSANVRVLAFTEPVSCTVIASNAGYFQPPRRSARMTNAVIHGMPAHGGSSTLVCDENCSAYGVNAYATIPTAIPGPRIPSVRSR